MVRKAENVEWDKNARHLRSVPKKTKKASSKNNLKGQLERLKEENTRLTKELQEEREGNKARLFEQAREDFSPEIVELIKKSLERNRGKRKAAASELGISERTLYRKIKQYDL